MILDNQNTELKVHEWIAKYTEDGTMDIVTGYFTIGALNFLSESTNANIDKYRMVLGDLVNFDPKFKTLNLLNENIGIDTALKLATTAKKATTFLGLNKIEIKTVEPNFCHAKLYLKTGKNDDRHNYFISGSSNLTEAGMGSKHTSNVELNIAEHSNNDQHKALALWFNNLWNNDKTYTDKTILNKNGKETKQNFKAYLIQEITRLFELYTPEQIYYKILFELFNTNDNDAEVEKQLGKLDDTVVYKQLYDFQKGAVRSLITMLAKHNGAILADAVGLGKTWTAIAVIKAYQMQGTEVVVFCPKKLAQNWTQYLKKNNSLFEDDKLDYEIKFHTDLREGGLHTNKLNEDYFTSDKPKLFVIDESHNLRNDKAIKYKYLVEQVLQKSKGEIKILLLSATPINNSFKDIRNQFKLMVKGQNDGFKDSLAVNSVETTFGHMQGEFNKWSAVPNATLASFHEQIKDSDFFKLTDALLVARTRKNIKANYNSSLTFPIHNMPINIFKTPLRFGDVENFAELMDNMKLNLSAYLPSTYLLSKQERDNKIQNRDVLKDGEQREKFLVKMMMILMLKRLESSWYAFDSTVTKILQHHTNLITLIDKYQDRNEDAELVIDVVDDEDAIEDLDEEKKQKIKILFGKKNKVSIVDIDEAGNLNEFKTEIKKDKKNLEYIVNNIKTFKEKFATETTLKSTDIKLQELLKIITEKQQQTNKKVIIFSAYKDTVTYLGKQLAERKFTHYATVNGQESKAWNDAVATPKHETILQRFAPYTKLYKEKNWPNFTPSTTALTNAQKYSEWQTYIAQHEPKTAHKISADNAINILITTDVLSEGQNLQDADMVINYDIHWNPVRVIQRVGRIDRIGSPNVYVQSINFWPAKDIDDYINLKTRVENRMAMSKFSGTEIINDFTENFNEMVSSEKLDDQQNANMLRQMETTLQATLEEEVVGLNDFSFDNYRQALVHKLNQDKIALNDMPNGVFSGVKLTDSTATMQAGIIALLRRKIISTQYMQAPELRHELIYVDMEGNELSKNQKIILEQLNAIHLQPRYVAAPIECGDSQAIQQLSNALKTWICNQAITSELQEDGTVKQTMGKAVLDSLNKLKSGNADAINELKNEGNIAQHYTTDNFELVTWILIS